ncbi:MAG: VTT domain-containing protein [Actinobacteria bacterium]|nr:VTT domain-containing protein [Actinomycetota bacterium]
MATRTRSRTERRLRKVRVWLVVLAGIRTVLGILAIPLAPVLYRKHFLVLVLLRPTKEVLLAGGFLVRQGKVNLVVLLAASIPLAILGVWHFYFLGLAYAKEIQSGKAIPSFAGRLLPVKRIKKLSKVLDKRGTSIVVIGRLASFPSALLGAAAGASGMQAGTFIPADLVGGLLSIAEVIGAGYLLGEAYHDAGPWLTVVGVVLLFALMIGVGRAMVRE